MNSVPVGSDRSEPPGISRGLTLLFAFAAGAAVANLYWAQPLLRDIADSLHVPAGTAGLLVTVTQVGYAVGVFLIVPLGDSTDRRRLIPAVMVCSALALAASALAPTSAVLLGTLAAVGLTALTGQLLIPLAGDLARAPQRGQVIGTVVSGILSGVLVSRTISGLLADALGWRAVYIAAALVTLVLAAVLGRVIPHVTPRAAVPHRELIASIFAVVRQHRSVQATLILGAAGFSSLTMFWTGLTFFLSGAPYFYSAAQIGLVGLAGLGGALVAQFAGKLHDRGWSIPATGAALVLALASLCAAALGSASIVVMLVVVVLFDVAIQVLNVLNTARLLSVDPSARSRLNTAFVTCNFVGGACGSALAGVLWQRGGWALLMLGGCVAIGLALFVWLTQREKALAPCQRAESAAEAENSAP